ncbi:MAG: hypothetical protein ACYDGM_05560 [Vulcanimicrobiaceae bacterium]
MKLTEAQRKSLKIAHMRQLRERCVRTFGETHQALVVACDVSERVFGCSPREIVSEYGVAPGIVAWSEDERYKYTKKYPGFFDLFMKVADEQLAEVPALIEQVIVGESVRVRQEEQVATSPDSPGGEEARVKDAVDRFTDESGGKGGGLTEKYVKLPKMHPPGFHMGV